MSTFKHAGDLGDIIYGMAVMKVLGGGTLALHRAQWTRAGMTPLLLETIRPLLEAQPYVDKVRMLIPGEKIDHDLNNFRALYFKAWHQFGFPTRKSLAAWMSEAHGLPLSIYNDPWISVDPNRVAKVVINRSTRYNNPLFPWKKAVEKYGADAIFCGYKYESDKFNHDFGVNVPFHTTKDLLELAQVIAGADLFIGNQSCAYAIAEAMKHIAVLEVDPKLPNCLFGRPDCVQGWNQETKLPDLTC